MRGHIRTKRVSAGRAEQRINKNKRKYALSVGRNISFFLLMHHSLFLPLTIAQGCPVRLLVKTASLCNTSTKHPACFQHPSTPMKTKHSLPKVITCKQIKSQNRKYGRLKGLVCLSQDMGDALQHNVILPHLFLRVNVHCHDQLHLLRGESPRPREVEAELLVIYERSHLIAHSVARLHHSAAEHLQNHTSAQVCSTVESSTSFVAQST